MVGVSADELMAKQGPLDTIAQRMKGELESDVAKLKLTLEGELKGAGTTEQSQADYLQVWFRKWSDPTFRAGMLQQVGPKHFLDTARAMVTRFGQPPMNTPPVALSPAGAVPAGVAQGGPTGVGLPPVGAEPASLPQPIPSPVTGATAPESPAVEARFGVPG